MAHRESWQSTQVESYISQAQQALASGNYQTAMNYAQQAQTLAQQSVSVGDHGDRGAAYWNERASTAGSILSQASSSLQTQQAIPVPATVPAECQCWRPWGQGGSLLEREGEYRRVNTQSSKLIFTNPTGHTSPSHSPSPSPFAHFSTRNSDTNGDTCVTAGATAGHGETTTTSSL